MSGKLLNYKGIHPLPLRQKASAQQVFPLRKLTFKQKMYFRKSQRVFSLEYGRYLQKRILWKMIHYRGLNSQPAIDTSHTIRPALLKSIQHLNKVFYPKDQSHLLAKVYDSLLKSKKISDQTPKMDENLTFETKFKSFHAMVLHKKWQFDNASLVPGMVWPLKNKRWLVSKMRAFKSLSHLVQARNMSVFTKMLQKLWNQPSVTKPSIWSVASGMDSLKAQVLLKTGWIPTSKVAKRLQNQPKFCYPGDLVSAGSRHDQVLALLFSAGPKNVFKKITKGSYGQIHRNKDPIYSKLPFLWTSSFYQPKFSKKISSFFIIPWNIAKR